MGRRQQRSPSSRRAWIEIIVRVIFALTISSPSSRRAWIEIGHGGQLLAVHPVALLAEGVDRNPVDNNAFLNLDKSPSSRRAWIEICVRLSGRGAGKVALLAEGVDRNAAQKVP